MSNFFMESLETNISYIYGLKSSRDIDKIKYIGKTDFPERRIVEHIKDSRKKKYRVHFWIQKEVNDGYKIEQEILGCFNQEDIYNKERDIIRLYKSFGANLVNGDNGGLGGKKLTKESQLNLLQKTRNVSDGSEYIKNIFTLYNSGYPEHKIAELYKTDRKNINRILKKEVFRDLSTNLFRTRRRNAKKGIDRSKSKDCRIYLLDENNNLINQWKNVYEACNFYGVSKSTIYKKFDKKSKHGIFTQNFKICKE